jgi:TonB family protein
MTAPVFYLIRVIVCSALFAGCYRLLLRNGCFHRWNRFYIVASVALSAVIPLLNIPVHGLYMATPVALDAIAEYFIIAPTEADAATDAVKPEPPSISWTWLVVIAWMFTVLFLFTKEVLSFVRILRLKRYAERIRIPETVLYCTHDAAAPFTFFRTIFWKKGIDVNSGNGALMLRHELAHVRFAHSRDKALMQLVCCLFWMNPFFYFFRRELELVHEFEADSDCIGDDAQKLASMILSTLYPMYYRDFTSRFFQSNNIKRRIFMITNRKKSKMNVLRKMSIVPVAIAAMLLFSGSSESRYDEREITPKTELTPAMTTADTESKTVSEVMDTNDDEIFLYAKVAVKPKFNGGDAEKLFREYANSKIVYPKEAIEKGIMGRVFTQFVIDTDGSITDIKVLRGVDPLLDEEVVRVVKTSPKWTPGESDGKKVKVKYQFPFLFQLN